MRLDSQATGPGESYNLEIEGGAGGVQQAAGDFLWHCHIAHHYLAGMWAFWRTYDTLQPDLMPLPDRAARAAGVDSAGLIGRTMPDGTVITKDNLDSWIRPQLPPQGKKNNTQDAAVLDWKIDATNPTKPVYLNEPEDTTVWPNNKNVIPGHPTGERGDVFVGNRPKILFDPLNGRPAFPLLRTHVGVRPPFSGNGHSGAPWLGERADDDTGRRRPGALDGAPGRPLPARRAGRRGPFNLVGIERDINDTASGLANTNGAIFALADEKQGKLDGSDPVRSADHPRQRGRLRAPDADVRDERHARPPTASRRSTCTSTTCSSIRRPRTASSPATRTSSPCARTSSRIRS